MIAATVRAAATDSGGFGGKSGRAVDSRINEAGDDGDTDVEVESLIGRSEQIRRGTLRRPAYSRRRPIATILGLFPATAG
jgi:hypothetical protein